MQNELEKISICVSPVMEDALNYAKSSEYRGVSQNEMLLDLIRRGLNAAREGAARV